MCPEPSRTGSENFVEMNLFVLGGFYRVDFSPQILWGCAVRRNDYPKGRLWRVRFFSASLKP